MSAKTLILLFVLYAGPSIAALLFLMLGFIMARTRLEVILTAALAGGLVAVHAGELWFLWSLRLAWGGERDDPLVLAGILIAACAVVLNVFFVRRQLRTSGAG